MQIAMKCWTPEHYDFVSHAVLEVDIALVDNLLAKLALADRMIIEQKALGRFMGLEFDSYDPVFIDATPDTLGISEDEYDEELSDVGHIILPAKMDGHEWEQVAIRPCFQMVMAGDVVHHRLPGKVGGGRVYWYGYDKHGDASCRAETYSLYEKDLRDIREALEHEGHS